MRAIPNNRAAATFVVSKPWEQWAEFPLPADIKTKKEMEAWRTASTTNHAFISGVEGLDPKRRVTDKGAGGGEDNPPASMSALIVDYDAAVSDERVAVLLADGAGPYAPSYELKSFSEEGDSGRFKRRLVWMFERPVRLCGSAHAKNFFKLLAERLAARKWLAGYDAAGHRPSMYFEIGRDWRPVSRSPIPHTSLLGWAAEAAKGIRVGDGGDRSPVDASKIAELVAERFPGRWDGEFASGAQGVRFWDPSADNPRGCVVGEHGMICFTGQKNFVSWDEIFGRKAMDELRGNQWGRLMDEFFWTPEPSRFWRFSQAVGKWRPCGVEDLRRTLRVNGVSASRKGGAPSEMDKLEEAIVTANEVAAALPFVHRKSGPIMFEGERYLNTAVSRVMEPAPELDTSMTYELDTFGKAYFPWIRSFFCQWFEPPKKRPAWAPEDVPLSDIPMIINMAWVQRCYQGGYRQNPKVRQGIVLAGPPGVGKTFYVRGLLGALLGPVADGTSLMVEGKDFTSLVAERPINFVDDSTPATSPEFHRRFTSLMKKLAASKVMRYNKKYGGEGQVEWTGSVILALNLDPESQRSLPSLDQSNLDKTSLFQVKNGIFLPGEDEQQAFLDKELPFFARFLLHWTPPEWALAPTAYRGRYGVRAYHHASLREAASSTGVPSTLLDVMRDILDEWREAPGAVAELLQGAVETTPPGTDKGSRCWEWTGRSSRFYRELAAYASSIVGRLSNQQVSGALATLASRGFGVEKLENGKWKVKFDDALLRPFDPAMNTEYQS